MSSNSNVYEGSQDAIVVVGVICFSGGGLVCGWVLE